MSGFQMTIRYTIVRFYDNSLRLFAIIDTYTETQVLQTIVQQLFKGKALDKYDISMFKKLFDNWVLEWIFIPEYWKTSFRDVKRNYQNVTGVESYAVSEAANNWVLQVRRWNIFSDDDSDFFRVRLYLMGWAQNSTWCWIRSNVLGGGPLKQM